MIPINELKTNDVVWTYSYIVGGKGAVIAMPHYVREIDDVDHVKLGDFPNEPGNHGTGNNLIYKTLDDLKKDLKCEVVADERWLDKQKTRREEGSMTKVGNIDPRDFATLDHAIETLNEIFKNLQNGDDLVDFELRFNESSGMLEVYSYDVVPSMLPFQIVKNEIENSGKRIRTLIDEYKKQFNKPQSAWEKIKRFFKR